MADVKISALPAGVSYSPGDVLPVSQSGTTKKIDLTAQLFVSSGGPSPELVTGDDGDLITVG